MRCFACANCRNLLGLSPHKLCPNVDRSNQCFQKDGSIKKPDRSFLTNAPIELKLLSVLFEKLVRQVQSTQKKLEEANLDLTHQVNLRTRTLNQRNQELRALQFLLAPLRDEAQVVIKRTVESFRLILGLNYLTFADKPESDRPDLASLPVELSTGVLGYLNFERPDYTQENRVHTSLQRLANSIAIVLDNQEMFSSVKASQSRFNALLESMTEGVVLIGKPAVCCMPIKPPEEFYRFLLKLRLPRSRAISKNVLERCI